MRIKRGDTLIVDVRRESAGQPVDLTGYTIRAQVRTAQGALLATLTPTITDAPGGRVQLRAAAATTATWEPGSYRYDVEFTSPAGDVLSSETLPLSVVADVTRDS